MVKLACKTVCLDFVVRALVDGHACWDFTVRVRASTVRVEI